MIRLAPGPVFGWQCQRARTPAWPLDAGGSVIHLRAGVHHEAAVGRRRRADGSLQEPVEEHAALSGLPTVEAEHELIEVSLGMPWLHGALVGAEQPALQQGSDPMHRRKARSVGVFASGMTCMRQRPYPLGSNSSTAMAISVLPSPGPAHDDISGIACGPIRWIPHRHTGFT